MMKRFIALCLALIFALALVACSAPAAPAPAATPAAENAETEPAVESTEESAEAEPTESPAPEKQLPPPPDIDINSWEFLYAGISNGVGGYHPAVRNIEEQLLDERIVPATHAFLDAAREQGYTVYIGVGYRNSEYTTFWFLHAMSIYGSAYDTCQVPYIFPPGCSEHSTGLAIDITDEELYAANYYEMHDETVKDTEVYKWMAEHCQDYGFIVRYPEGKEAFYEKPCYPGHFRYVGEDAAKYIMENDLCFEEFLALYK